VRVGAGAFGEADSWGAAERFRFGADQFPERPEFGSGAEDDPVSAEEPAGCSAVVHRGLRGVGRDDVHAGEDAERLVERPDGEAQAADAVGVWPGRVDASAAFSCARVGELRRCVHLCAAGDGPCGEGDARLASRRAIGGFVHERGTRSRVRLPSRDG